MINEDLVNSILDTVPDGARCCYTGQSILAYVDNPTFSWDEVNTWENETDMDLFAYSPQSQATLIQAFMSDGWKPENSIEKFKADRVRFWDPGKFNLQTVKLIKDGYPELNISWRKGSEDCLDVIKVFDMDYLMVSMDVSKRVFADLRPVNKRVAHVNKLNPHFNPYDAEPSYWYRQFERCPKGWSRGIDTRPVAQQYIEWIETSLKIGDKGAASKTREYKNRAMMDAIAPLIEHGMEQEVAELIYKLSYGQNSSWDATKLKHTVMVNRIKAWLDAVNKEEK